MMSAGEGAEKQDDLRTFLLGVPLGQDERKKIISTLAKEVSMKQETLDFLHLLVDVNRLDAIEDIISAFDEKYNTITDTQVSSLTTTMPPQGAHGRICCFLGLRGRAHTTSARVVPVLRGPNLNCNLNSNGHTVTAIPSRQVRKVGFFAK